MNPLPEAADVDVVAEFELSLSLSLSTSVYKIPELMKRGSNSTGVFFGILKELRECMNGSGGAGTIDDVSFFSFSLSLSLSRSFSD